MVDFNAKETIGTPAVDVVRLLWLQARDNLLQDWEKHIKSKMEGHEPTLYQVQARLITLFNEMQAYLNRTLPPKKAPEGEFSFEGLYNTIYSDSITYEQVRAIILFFNVRLDRITLIKIDTKQKYDKFDLEAENKVNGLD